MHNAAHWIKTLNLQPHPEGGWFKETYRALGAINGRNFSTAIYFLLEAGQRSVFHRIKSDEIWHFYAGKPLDIHILGQDTIRLGPDAPLAVVPANRWFGARLSPAYGYALVGCTVSPGFDFADFEIARRGELLSQFPEHRDIILALTHDD